MVFVVIIQWLGVVLPEQFDFHITFFTICSRGSNSNYVVAKDTAAHSQFQIHLFIIPSNRRNNNKRKKKGRSTFIRSVVVFWCAFGLTARLEKASHYSHSINSTVGYKSSIKAGC